jgi:flagellar hook assembly protein FlgD
MDPVTLTIYNLKGEKVRILADGRMAGGSHKAVWDGLDAGGVPVPSGVYVYRLEAGDRMLSKRMVLMR